MIMDFETLLSTLPGFAEGLAWTLLLTVSVLFFGMIIALMIVPCRLSRNRAANGFGLTFVFVFRGAPLLVLLFLIYYGVPELPIVRDTFLWLAFQHPVFCAILALSLNSAGYLTEVIVGAVRAVPRGEIEAAHVAGLSRWTVIKGIIAPNAIRLGLRNYGNEMIFVVKATSIASLVTIQELMARASGVYYRTYDPITPLLIAGAIFLVLILALSSFMALLEVRLSPELRRKAERARPRAGKTAPGLTAVDGPSLPQTPGTGR